MIAAESCHWYKRNGEPCYEVDRADGKGKRPTTLADARKLNLVPSVTTIIDCAAKPGLVNWKLDQIVDAALTLPTYDGETLDDYKRRVIEDADAQSKRARDRGTALHEAIECYVQGKQYDRFWYNHIKMVEHVLKQQCGLELAPANAEKTFATEAYGGKIDWKQGNALADFKTKDRIENGKKLAYDNHVMQLAAYAVGQTDEIIDRHLSIFIGVEDEKVQIYEWLHKDVMRGLQMFEALVKFWQLSKNWDA